MKKYYKEVKSNRDGIDIWNTKENIFGITEYIEDSWEYWDRLSEVWYSCNECGKVKNVEIVDGSVCCKYCGRDLELG